MKNIISSSLLTLFLLATGIALATPDAAKKITPMLTILLSGTSPSGALNDSGIDWGRGKFPLVNNIDCTSNILAEQDCDRGRDAELDIDSDGHAGFSFRKIDSGNCVQDNVTGYMWEVKTDDGGLHDRNDRYNWYNTDSATNGGGNGSEDADGDICYGYINADATTYCNTQAYVARVNAEGWCGYHDWYLPSKEQLRGILDYSVYTPAIDTSYFPNTESSYFWSSSPSAHNSNHSWIVYFIFGSSARDGVRSWESSVRLVRDGG